MSKLNYIYVVNGNRCAPSHIPQTEKEACATGKGISMHLVAKVGVVHPGNDLCLASYDNGTLVGMIMGTEC